MELPADDDVGPSIAAQQQVVPMAHKNSRKSQPKYLVNDPVCLVIPTQSMMMAIFIFNKIHFSLLYNIMSISALSKVCN